MPVFFLISQVFGARSAELIYFTPLCQECRYFCRVTRFEEKTPSVLETIRSFCGTFHLNPIIHPRKVRAVTPPPLLTAKLMLLHLDH